MANPYPGLSSRERGSPGRQILLVGGIGRMETQYRALVESRGFELIYRERKITGGTPAATLAAILVVTTVVSHPLRDHAARLAGACRVPIVYLRAPSLSAVRKALDEAVGGTATP